MKQALDGLMLAARIAAQHNVDEVMDSIVVSLCKFTAVLNPNGPKPTIAFGEDYKARQARWPLRCHPARTACLPACPPCLCGLPC